jgi:MFS family permease
MLVCAVALTFVPDVEPVAAGHMIGRRLREIWRDFRSLTRSAHARFVIVLFLTPISAGGMNLLWSAVAPSWHVTPDHVAVVTGAGFGLSAAGSVTGGWLVDRVGLWWVYFGSQVLMTAVAAAMTALPRTPDVYTTGLLCYLFASGVS